MNDAGDVTTRGKLIESSEAFMTTDEVTENRIKIEKKLKKSKTSTKRTSLKSTEAKSSINVNVETTLHSKRKAKKNSDPVGNSSVEASATFKRKIVRIPEVKTSNESSELTILKAENVYVQQSEETFISEIEHKTFNTTIKINNLKDIECLKNSNEINEILKKVKLEYLGKENEPIKELAVISFMLQSGLSTNDIQKLFELKLFPNLQATESQSAFVHVLEREGFANLVTEILSEKSESEIDDDFISTVGFRAFLKMIDLRKVKIEDLILIITPEDFASNWKLNSSEV